MNALCGWVCGMCRQLANGYTRQKVICELPVTNLGNYDFTVRSTLTPPSPLGPPARLGFRCSCAKRHRIALTSWASGETLAFL